MGEILEALNNVKVWAKCKFEETEHLDFIDFFIPFLFGFTILFFQNFNTNVFDFFDILKVVEAWIIEKLPALNFEKTVKNFKVVFDGQWFGFGFLSRILVIFVILVWAVPGIVNDLWDGFEEVGKLNQVQST